MKRTYVCVFLLSLFVFAETSAARTRIFYSDLTSGPNSGGQNNQGAFVTLYGTGFGASRGSSTVTIGGGAAANYPVWSDNKIVFQLGPSALSGRIVVHVNGTNSSGPQFTVRSGHIYFVSPSGSDSADGSFNAPWQSVPHAITSVVAGDIVYLLDGTTLSTTGANGAAITLTTSGTSSYPIAIAAYPGASATLGANGTPYAIFSTATVRYWIFAGLQIRASQAAIATTYTNGWRVIGNDISCPSAQSTGACIKAQHAGGLVLLGNAIHDSGATGSAQYDGVDIVFGNNIEVGWNEIAQTNGCSALEIRSSSYQYNLRIHDNFVHDARCDGIHLANVDPSRAAVTVYNNIIARAGTGSAAQSEFACISVAGSGSGRVQIKNDTLHDCGSQGGGSAGAIAASTPALLQDNILDVTSSETYLTSATDPSLLTGSNNLFNGSANVPASLASSVTADPQFVDDSHDNYQLQASSAAIDAGMNTGITRDFFGTSRPQGTAYDIGAIEFTGTPAPSTQGQLTASPTSVNFGSVVVGSNSTQSITLTNTGGSTVTISQATVSGTGFSSPGLQTPLTVAAGASATLSVVFSPNAASSFSGTATITSDASNSLLAIALSGTGAEAPQAQLSANPANINFGNVAAGASSSQTITLTNSGNADTTISQVTATGAGFTVGGITVPYTLSAGKTVTLQATFSPTSATSYSGSISVASNAPNSPLIIALSGTGTPTPQAQLSANPASVTFPSITVGSSSSQNVTLTNTGNADATISNVAVTGTGFRVAALTLPYTLKAGTNVALQVTFAPSAAGTYTGSLTITSNAANSTLTVALSGTATTATVQHSVDLNWSESVSGIAGFNLYRSTTTGGPYTKINSSLITTMAFNDSTVQSGQTYFYVVTAVDTSNQESGYSNQAQAVIPSP